MRVRLLPATDALFAWMLGDRAPPPLSLSLPPGGLEEAWVLQWLRGNLRTLGGAGSWLIVDGEEVVGLCNYKAPPDSKGAVEIGYAVAPARRRRGYATAGLAALVKEAARDRRITRLVAQIAVANAGSQRVAQANGFTRYGKSTDPDDGEMDLWGLNCGPV